MNLVRLRMLILFLTLSSTALAAQGPAVEEDQGPDYGELLSSMKYRHIGPVGNRVSAVIGIPGNPDVYYIGAASGGVFKSEDGGVHWKPIFDGQPVASIGSLAVSRSDPNVVWAGTGEANIRSNISAGMGIYKSVDAGTSWKLMGLENTGRISRVLIHPTNPDFVFAAAQGHGYGPQEERGVHRTLDGGETWEKVLFVDENTGASDLVMDPNNPRVLFAGMWEMKIWTWGRQSGGSAGGVFVSRDLGATWEKIEGKGIPKPPTGNIGLAMTPDDSNRIYALIETNSNRDFADLTDHQGVLWRSDNGGRQWRLISSDNTLVQRPHYYTRVYAAPDDADEVHFLATRHSRSLDGGRSYDNLRSGGDHHDIWIDPLQPDRIIVGHDQGISISSNRGKSWMRPRLPIAQIYHAYTDNSIPYFVYGNRQDGASQRGPSNSLTRGDIPIGAWHSVGGCESGFAIPDPEDDNIVWSGCYEGILDRYNRRTGHSRTVSVWPDNPEGWAAADLKYRFQWTFPLVVSPHDHNRVYAGSQYVHVTTDGGHSWKVISPDLTTNDKSKQQKTGGLTFDDVSPTYAAVLFSLAESPLQEGVIWAGSNDGKLHLTRDGGTSWTDVGRNISGLPPWGTISNIEASRHAVGTAYITVDLHQVNNFDPFVYRTEDFGASWTSISAGLPRHPLSYAHCVREDTEKKGLLFLGTENALHFSLDDGASWQPLQNNLPQAPVHWITVEPRFSDLVVATYGRGFWILDDISAIRTLSDEVLDSEIHLFAPRPAYRFRIKEAPQSQPEDPGAGKNPAYGASIHYYLKEKAEEVWIEIRDSEGLLVREMRKVPAKDTANGRQVDGPPGREGMNRIYWDLRHERSDLARLRTRPIENEKTPLPDRGWRPLVEGRRVAPLASPGSYTIKVHADELEATQTLKVVKDPNSEGSDEDARGQTHLLLQIRDDVNNVVGLINRIEWLRKQVTDLQSRLEQFPGDGQQEVTDAGRKLNEELAELEGRFFDLRMTGGNARQDSLRYPRRLYSKLTSLHGYIDKTDSPATTQQLEVYEIYRERLLAAEERFQEIRDGSLGDFNRLLNRKGLSGVIMVP